VTSAIRRPAGLPVPFEWLHTSTVAFGSGP
jgi:hypothetical protein